MKNNTGSASFVVLFVIAIVMPLVLLYEGWAISMIWKLIIVSQFNVSPLSIPQAIGISVLGSYHLKSVTIAMQQNSDGSKDKLAFLITTMITPMFYVILAWVVSLFL